MQIEILTLCVVTLPDGFFVDSPAHDDAALRGALLGLGGPCRLPQGSIIDFRVHKDDAGSDGEMSVWLRENANALREVMARYVIQINGETLTRPEWQ